MRWAEVVCTDVMSELRFGDVRKHVVEGSGWCCEVDQQLLEIGYCKIYVLAHGVNSRCT